MPRLAAFPKCYMDALCVERSMTLFQWIDMARALPVEGLELYPGFFESFEPAYLARVKQTLEQAGFSMPMFCCSPDFTPADPARRRAEIEKYERILDTVQFLGGKTCRILSGQRYPEVSRADGVRWTVEGIHAALDLAAPRGITLVMENHYKDGYWEYPEFAQHLDVFLEILAQIDSPWFGVNYDPSNAIVAGEDPLVVLRAVAPRVATMHASDRYLANDDAASRAALSQRRHGYAAQLVHGVIGEGLNDYDAIFTILREHGFDGWISLEDGMNGMAEMQRSCRFLLEKIERRFGRRPGLTPGAGQFTPGRDEDK